MMTDTKRQHGRRSIIVVGCDDVGSAIACILHRAGAAVVVVDGADPPWSRRGMSYTDAWYVGGATLDGVDACFCGSVKSISPVLDRGDMVAATTWSWQGVAAVVCPAAVIETRQGRVALPAQCRPATLENVLAIGVRATHVGGWPADVVIADGFTRSDGARGDGRIADTALSRIEAPHGGRFRTRHEIAERVDAGDVIGELGGFAVVARVTGVLRALAARGARVAPGDMLAEVDGRNEPSNCFGITAEARAIAHRVAAAVRRPYRRAGAADPARHAVRHRLAIVGRAPGTGNLIRSTAFGFTAEAPSRMPVDYLQKILTAKVYDVAVETPLELAASLSERLGNRVLLKREDQQPVFSFKLRGAYNKMAQLRAAERARGVIAHRPATTRRALHSPRSGSVAMRRSSCRSRRRRSRSRPSRSVARKSFCTAIRTRMPTRRRANCRRRRALRSCIRTTTPTSSRGRARSGWRSCASATDRSTRSSSPSAAAD
jgi:predicted deacylase